jgi:hypothetical protein
MQLGNWNNKAFKILVNINAERDYLHLRFRNNTDAVITSVALKNGENIIPAQNIEGATKAVFEYSLKEGETITITQIPDYPDQLCYIRAKKDSIIEEANKELELFKKFQIAAQANPKLTYVDFCNNIKNKEV